MWHYKIVYSSFGKSIVVGRVEYFEEHYRREMFVLNNINIYPKYQNRGFARKAITELAKRAADKYPNSPYPFQINQITNPFTWRAAKDIFSLNSLEVRAYFSIGDIKSTEWIKYGDRRFNEIVNGYLMKSKDGQMRYENPFYLRGKLHSSYSVDTPGIPLPRTPQIKNTQIQNDKEENGIVFNLAANLPKPAASPAQKESASSAVEAKTKGSQNSITASPTVVSGQKDFSGLGWIVPWVEMPEKFGTTIEEDMRNVIKVFNNQFGSLKVVTDRNPVALGERGLAKLHSRIGSDMYYPTLQSEGVSKHRALQVRLMAHEVQHARSKNKDYFDLFDLLWHVPEFQALQGKFSDQYKKVMEMGLSYKPFKEEEQHYLLPDEILARLRAYQVYLEQGREEAGAAEFHEFFEILTPNDLRWLDPNYLKRETSRVTKPPSLPIKQSGPLVVNKEDLHDDSSSPLVNKDEKGGIDFRALPVVSSPINPAMLRLSPAQIKRLSNLNLDAEWAEIQNMLKAGIIPSNERVREYVASSCLKQSLGNQMGKVLGCIANILRMEEDRVTQTEPELEDMLVLIESGKPESELQLGLVQIQIQPKEPQKVSQ